MKDLWKVNVHDLMLDGGKFICHKVRLQQNVGRKKKFRTEK